MAAENETPEDASSELPPGIPRRVGNYELVEKVGEGGMGAVYKAKHVELGNLAAVKFLSPTLAENTVFVRRFEREARLAANLSSPYSVRTFDVGEVNGRRYILMDFVEGETLDSILDRRERLDETEALSIVYDVAQALNEAHEMGIVHRDIKPENIIVNKRGVPKLTDLGVAKETNDDKGLTMTGFAVGTPSFMSSEQAQGIVDIDARSDIYSLGATLYRMVVGDLPFDGPTPLSVMHKIATEPVPDPLKVRPSLSRDVAVLICRMMARDRNERYQTIEQVMRDIAAIRSGEHTGVHYAAAASLLGVEAEEDTRLSAAARVEQAWRRKILIGGGIGGAVIILVVIGILALGGSENGRPKPSTEPGASVPTEPQPVTPTQAPLAIVEPPEQPAPAPEPIPAPTPPPEPEPAPTPTPAPTPAPDPQPTPSPTPEPSPTPQPEPAPTPTPEPAPTPQPEPAPPPTPEPQPEPEPPEPPFGREPVYENCIGMKLAHVQAGSFTMGSRPNEPGRLIAEGPRHEVALSRPFYLGAFEVTNEEYETAFPEHKTARPNGAKDDHPVVNVSWNEAMAFCEWLSKSDGHQYRLPTEAEWEYACRAGTDTAYSWGDAFDAGKTQAGKNTDTVAVGRFSPNAWGLYDMHGNVWEWCADWYLDVYYENSPATDPAGPAEGDARVLRGGSAVLSENLSRSGFRYRSTAETRNSLFGFRVLCEIGDQAKANVER